MAMLCRLKLLKTTFSRTSFSVVSSTSHIVPDQWHRTQSAYFATEPRIVRYYKPQYGWFSLNIDGGYRYYDYTGAVGGLLRDHNGAVIMGFSEYFPEDESKDSFYMECAALVSGLEKVVKLGVDKIEIRSDAQTMVQTLCKEIPVGEKYKKEYQKIFNMMNKISNLNITFVSRRANKAADYLVKMAYSHMKKVYFEGECDVLGDKILDQIIKRER